MIPWPSNLALSRPTVKFREVLLSSWCAAPHYLPGSHKHVCSVVALSVYVSLKDMMITTKLVSGRGPFQELSVIGDERCELVALCVSRLQAGVCETPSGQHNMAVDTWCVKTSMSLMN